MKKIIPFLLSMVLVIIVGAYWFLNYTGINKDFASVGTSYLINIKPGMPTPDIANLLHNNKLVKTQESFLLEARFRGLEHRLQAGQYQINAGMSNA